MFPYEWFDSPEKLDYPRFPDYPEWYSRLKEEYTLKLSEWVGCKRYYNNLDVAPGLEALEKCGPFTLRIDILNDAVSIPGVSLHYLL